MNRKLKTWSPFQSEDVRQICEHMTEDELAALQLRAAFNGMWGALTLGIPFALAVTRRTSLAVGMAVPLIIIHLVSIPFLQRGTRSALCSTKWAREQGYSADQLSMFSFRVRRAIARK